MLAVEKWAQGKLPFIALVTPQISTAMGKRFYDCCSSIKFSAIWVMRCTINGRRP